MNIALIGYGKMGKLIEKIALEQKHTIACVIDKSNITDFNSEAFKAADVAIEFSTPDGVLQNITHCLQAKVPIVVGTTGWHTHYKEVEEQCVNLNGSIIHATNFSIGVNLFFALNKKLASLMANYKNSYNLTIEEIHHTQKTDAPSGTAVSLASDIINNNTNYNNWNLINDQDASNHVIGIKAKRIDQVVGTHIVKYSSKIDEIEIMHKANNREGFANGAILAANWILNKKGIFTMQDMLGL